MSVYETPEWKGPSGKHNVKKSMEVLDEVQNNYKNKLRQLNYFGTKKKVIQLKFEIFQDWIRYLQEENKLLSQLVIELEEDVIKECETLKKKTSCCSNSLSTESKAAQVSTTSCKSEDCENNIKMYRNDVKNLLLFLEAIRENRTESIRLPFYFVKEEEIFGVPPIKYSNKSDEKLILDLKSDRHNLQLKNDELQAELSNKDKLIQEQELKINELQDKIIKQDQIYQEESARRRHKDANEAYDKANYLSSKPSHVWEASKEVTNNMIQIWDKLVDKKICDDSHGSNCHVVMDKNDDALGTLQQAVTQITKELQAQGTITKQSQGDALLFIVFDKNKNN